MKKFLFLVAVVSSAFSMKAQLVVTGFEAWHNISLGIPPAQFPCPNGWSGSDSALAVAGLLFGQTSPFSPGLAKELPGNNSNTALKVMTVNQPGLPGLFPAGPFPTFVTNGKIEIDLTAQELKIGGGFPLAEVPHSVSMWVKNNVILNDTTQINIESIDDGDNLGVIVATADTLLWNNLTTYTKITLPLTIVDGSISPTHLRVSISSNSDNSDTAYVGTYIVVDDIQVNYPNGVQQYLYSSKAASVYPTLFSNTLQVNLNVQDQKHYGFEMYDMLGRSVFKTTIKQSLNSIELNNLPQGNYIYQLSLADKTVQTGQLQKQ